MDGSSPFSVLDTALAALRDISDTIISFLLDGARSMPLVYVGVGIVVILILNWLLRPRSRRS